MNDKKLEDAVTEAKRFIAKAKALQSAKTEERYWESPKESGACRRASMDLTRALADLRKPG